MKRPLYPFTFASSGITVQIAKMSAMLRRDVALAVERDLGESRPMPPKTSVDYGNGTIEVEHREHPIYLQLMQEWRDHVNLETTERLIRHIIQRAIVCTPDAAAIAEARRDAADLGVMTDDLTDQEIFIRYVAIGPMEDYADLISAIYERSAPTEAAVQAHQAAF